MPKRSAEEAAALVRSVFGDTIEVKPIHEEPLKLDGFEAEVADLLTRVCYFYPQYTLDEAELLTDSQVTALLLQAEKQRDIDWYNQTLIAAAPHTKKGKLVDKLLKRFKKIIEMS